mgnify:CR=1 FL=1
MSKLNPGDPHAPGVIADAPAITPRQSPLGPGRRAGRDVDAVPDFAGARLDRSARAAAGRVSIVRLAGAPEPHRGVRDGIGGTVRDRPESL